MARTEAEMHGREIAKSTTINWGTTSPFELGEIKIEKVGFADLPVVQIMIGCKSEDLSNITPIARQVVFRELEAHGLESEILEYKPTVGTESSRRHTFTDGNESSPTKGKRKHGKLYHWRFEIKKEHVGHFKWGGFGGRYGSFPERKDS